MAGSCRNPVEAYRRQQKKKDKLRNRREKQKVREEGISQGNTSLLKGAINRLKRFDAEGKLSQKSKQRLLQLEKMYSQNLALLETSQAPSLPVQSSSSSSISSDSDDSESTSSESETSGIKGPNSTSETSNTNQALAEKATAIAAATAAAVAAVRKAQEMSFRNIPPPPQIPVPQVPPPPPLMASSISEIPIPPPEMYLQAMGYQRPPVTLSRPNPWATGNINGAFDPGPFHRPVPGSKLPPARSADQSHFSETTSSSPRQNQNDSVEKAQPVFVPTQLRRRAPPPKPTVIKPFHQPSLAKSSIAANRSLLHGQPLPVRQAEKPSISQDLEKEFSDFMEELKQCEPSE